jgi:hypothetical protein
VADGVEGWEVWLRRSFEGICKMVALGIYWPSRKWKQEHSTLVGKKTCKIHGRRTKYEVGRVYDSLKSFCLRSNHASNPPRCQSLEEARSLY